MAPESEMGENDAGKFHALDEFVERLHSGSKPDRSPRDDDDRHLAAIYDCLESLDDLAPPVWADPNNACDWSEQTAPHVPAVATCEAGREFGKYRLLEEAGRGGMGVVFKAHQTDLDRTVAVKMILASHLASEEQVRRFYNEARAAAKLAHANIVRIYEVGEIEGQHYFAMEYVEGPTLSACVARDRLDVENAVRIVAAIARAVHYLHVQGIVHRDLKPSNILLDASGRPVLTDFGLAKLLVGDSLATQSGTIAGTPSYMAPEQATGRHRDVGPLCDIYSLGAILYELLTGRPPFREEHPLETLVQVLESEPTLLRRLNPGVPRALEHICLKCLEKNPVNRYPSSQALADDLDRFLHGDIVEARPLGPVQKFRRWARRQPALASRLAALVVYLLIEQAWYFILQIVPLSHHIPVTLIVVVWGLASVAWQYASDRCNREQSAAAGWAVADLLCLTAILMVANGSRSPLIIGYPVLIVASGLWFRVRLVAFMTVAAVGAYGLLVVYTHRFRPELFADGPLFDHDAIFIISLMVLGCMVAYQAYRVRLLSRCYERRS